VKVLKAFTYNYLLLGLQKHEQPTDIVATKCKAIPLFGRRLG